MSFFRTVRDMVFPFGDSFAVILQQRLNVALTTGALTINMPTDSTNFSPAITAGYVRVKHTTNVVGTNANCRVLGITGTDGTNTYSLSQGDASLSANSALIDRVYPFRCDYGLTSITVTINNQNNGSNFDIEVSGNS